MTAARVQPIAGTTSEWWRLRTSATRSQELPGPPASAASEIRQGWKDGPHRTNRTWLGQQKAAGLASLRG